MTTNVDFELLAEHLEGALAGTPEGARVAELVATDPEWARAAADLSAALAAVAADLRTLQAPSLPADVAARLDAALRDRPVPEPAGPWLHGRPPDRRPGSRPRRQPSVGGASRTRRVSPRFLRWGMGIAVAAGIVAFAAVGIGSWVSDPSGTFTAGNGDDSGGAQVDAPESADGAARSAGGPLVTASGIDYAPSTLTAAQAPLAAPEEHASTQEYDGPATALALPEHVPAPLARLGSEPALAACLDAVSAEAEPPPGTIDRVDFASFEGAPALVIWLTTVGGEPWAWVAGPDCGVAGAGADIQFDTALS